MSAESWLGLAALGFGVGGLIGSVGVGGVLLVPALTVIFDMDVRVAIATCMFGYLFAGMAGIYLFGRRGSLAWRSTAWLALGAMPGAYFGAMSVAYFSEIWLLGTIAALMIATGLDTLRPDKGTRGRDRPLGSMALATIGAGVGYVSALTGTGGPVSLMPVLLALKVDILSAVGLGQAIQVPIGVLATARNFAADAIDLPIGLTLAITLIAGVAGGTRIAHALPANALRRMVAVVLVGFGLVIAINLARG